MTACGVSQTPTVPPTPTPTPQDLLQQAVTAFSGIESFHFDLALENRTLAVDQSGLLSFNKATGDVRPPDSLQASTVVQSAFGSINVSFVAIGDQQWLTNPLDNSWQETPPELQSDVGLLFNPTDGIGAQLARMENLERLANEDINGRDAIHLRGTLPGAALSRFAPDLAETPALTVDVYLDTASLWVSRIVMTQPPVDGETPTWTFDFSDHNSAAEINPPI